MPRPRITDRRQRILDAARALLIEQGWRRTTIDAVASRAGIGKGAVYLEFADKSAMLEAVLIRGTRTMTARMREHVAATEVLDLSAVYRLGVEVMLEDPLMTALLAGDEALLGEHARSVTDDRYTERAQLLIEYVSRLQRAGVLAPSIDSGDLVRVLSVFTVGLLNAGATGTLDGTQIAATVALFGDLITRGASASGPVDASAAHSAQLDLLDRLDTQLRGLDADT